MDGNHSELPSVDQILVATSFFVALGFPEIACDVAFVKARYKQLALKVHPDKCNDDRAKEAFQRISEAFEVLNNKSSQERYLRERAGSAPRRKSSVGKHCTTKSGAKGKPWWDTRTWDEFEQRLRNREQMEAALRAKFFNHVQGKYQHRRLRQQVTEAERSCEQLDRLKGIGESDLWPIELRELSNKTELQTAAFEGAKTAWDEILERNELDDPDYCASRLVDLLTHLRMVHIYCLHCGCHFDDAGDLERNCPGFDEEAHENAENMAMRRKVPDGVSYELAPPPKRRRPPPPPVDDDGDDSPFVALFAGGKAAPKRQSNPRPASSGMGGGVQGGAALTFGFRLQAK